jgi:hypothetical protein
VHWRWEEEVVEDIPHRESLFPRYSIANPQLLSIDD